jgi:hypothetical protein
MNFVDDKSSSSYSSFSDVDSDASLENNLHHDYIELIHKLHCYVQPVECKNDKHISYAMYPMLLRKGESVLQSIRLMRDGIRILLSDLFTLGVMTCLSSTFDYAMKISTSCTLKYLTS